MPYILLIKILYLFLFWLYQKYHFEKKILINAIIFWIIIIVWIIIILIIFIILFIGLFYNCYFSTVLLNNLDKLIEIHTNIKK